MLGVLIGQLDGLCEAECGVDAIQRRTSDTTGIAGSFTARVEVGRGNGLQGVRISDDTHGTAAAALDAEDDGIVGEEARVLAVKILKSLLQALAYVCRQPLVESAGYDARQVTAWRQVGTGLALHEIFHSLGRGDGGHW